jgi:hypothetical protein
MARAPRGDAERNAVGRFRKEVCARMNTVDPNGELDWYTLSFGFFLACGLSVTRATSMAIYVRYEKGYWCD